MPLLAYMQVISGDYGTGRCGYGPTQPCKACTANSCPYSTFGFRTESLGPDGLPLKLGVKPDVIDMVGSIIGGSPAFAVCHQLCVCTFLIVYRLQDVEIAQKIFIASPNRGARISHILLQVHPNTIALIT